MTNPRIPTPPSDSLADRIEAVRQTMGEDLLILGHHYQSDDVIRHADLRGDSFQLAKQAAAHTRCRAIVFCGVHFMAETADILANRPEAAARRGGLRIPVMLPDLDAGCPMADMASLPEVEACWHQLGQIIDTAEITPVTYVNSTADLKAFCGRHGGVVCTSSNARAVLAWAFSQRGRVLFFPDQHLGRNTAAEMGVPEHNMPVWDPQAPTYGGCSLDVIRDARVILWQGFCNVHMRFRPEHVDQMRAMYPGIRVIVHPECEREVVMRADASGSTGGIIQAIEAAPPGTRWAIGTEASLVQRLAAEHPDQEIHTLGPAPATCRTMKKTTPANLCWVLENLAAGTPVNVVRVDEAIATPALLALEQMLARA